MWKKSSTCSTPAIWPTPAKRTQIAYASSASGETSLAAGVLVPQKRAINLEPAICRAPSEPFVPTQLTKTTTALVPHCTNTLYCYLLDVQKSNSPWQCSLSSCLFTTTSEMFLRKTNLLASFLLVALFPLLRSHGTFTNHGVLLMLVIFCLSFSMFWCPFIQGAQLSKCRIGENGTNQIDHKQKKARNKAIILPLNVQAIIDLHPDLPARLVHTTLIYCILSLWSHHLPQECWNLKS